MSNSSQHQHDFMQDSANTVNRIGPSKVCCMDDIRHSLDKTLYLGENSSVHVKNALSGSLESVAHCVIPPTFPHQFGSSGFQKTYGTTASYMAGGMANGIASVELVIALGKAGFLGIFGAGGLSLRVVEQAISDIQTALPTGPYGFNWLSNAHNPEAEMALASLFLEHGVHTVEAAAFIEPSLALIYYRVSGLSVSGSGITLCANKIIAKISRTEVAEKFMAPPKWSNVEKLLKLGLISEGQALLSKNIPLAGDITVEADSGGHTDNRPLVSLLPSIISLRDVFQSQRLYDQSIRVGAAGGISTPHSVLAAFSMGADYVVTGSINQSCIESGTSTEVKSLLASAKMSDVVMAPSADMFEMGVKVQVLKKGTRFPLVAQKLFDLYKCCNSIEDIPEKDLSRLEKQAFKKSVDVIWDETKSFFEERDPKELAIALKNPKKKMALIFRWYLGKSSLWAIDGSTDTLINSQIWCGQSMGAFNDWTRGSTLERQENRKVIDVANALLDGAVLLNRVNTLKLFGADIKL